MSFPVFIAEKGFSRKDQLGTFPLQLYIVVGKTVVRRRRKAIGTILSQPVADFPVVFCLEILRLFFCRIQYYVKLFQNACFILLILTVFQLNIILEDV